MFNACREVPGTSIGSYAYFGPHPFKFGGYPLWIGMMAGHGLPLARFMAYCVANPVKGLSLLVTMAALIQW